MQLPGRGLLYPVCLVTVAALHACISWQPSTFPGAAIKSAAQIPLQVHAVHSCRSVWQPCSALSSICTSHSGFLQVSDAADSAKDSVKDVSNKAQNAVPDVSLFSDEQIGNAPKKAAEKAGSAADDVASSAKDAAKNVTSKAWA